MGKAPKKQRQRLKGCPYTVTITCDLTPPYNFIRKTRHKTYATAMAAIKKAKQEFKGTPGLCIELTKPTDQKPRTSWERILAT